MKLSKHAKFWALGVLGGVGLFALGVFAQQNGALDIDSTNQDLFSDLKAVFFLERKEDNNEIDSIVRLNVSNGTVVSAPTSDLAGGEAKNTLQNNASIIGSTNSVNTSSGAFLIATNSGRVQGESMQSFIWGASNTTLNGYNAIAVATKNTNLKADNTLALAAKDSTVSASDSVVLGGESITINPGSQASLAVWSKINVLGASGALVFNGKTIPLQVDTASAHTMVVNADNGLIINTNNSNNQKIQLTVSGAIKLWEVNNAPAQASPYISVKTKGSVTCVCGKVNNQNSALSKYTRGNKQIADLCQKVCDDQNTTLTAQCGAAATNYPLTQTQWSTDDFCQWGLGHAGAKPTFPALGGQVSWTCESFPSGGPTCTATRKGCGDGIRAAGEQCDLGTNNGKPDSNCSVSCENVKAPKCWANAKSYLGSDVAWAQPNGFCTDDSVLGEATPAFWNGSTSGQKTWTCKNKNNKNLTCSANRLPPAVAGACGTTLNTCSAGTLSGQTTIPHGDRWSCDGLYGGSNKTCSRCDSGYKYNTTTNICEIDCPNPIYRHTNGVTIKAAACAEAGREYMFEGQKYYVARDKDDIKAKIAANAYPANRIVTTRVTEFNQLFYDNHTFNQDIWNWDTSNVTNMYGMFRAAVAFNQQINNWDTSKVTTMQYMFYNARAFNQQINNWDTSKVTNMNAMFYNAITFNQPLNNWNTSNVTDMSLMFANIEVFNQPLNNWNTSKVTNMAAMFTSAKVFNQPLNSWDVSKVTDVREMFANTKAFNQPLNNWDTSNVTNMYGMFYWAKAFNQPLNNWNISKVTDMKYMFYWAETFNQPLNNRRINQISDENLKDIFGNATAFKENQPYCNWANWSAKKWNFVNMGLNACINGQCKAHPWNHASQPATSTANGCVGGDYQDIADDANNWKWKCNGKYWATSTECSASKQPAPVNAQCKVYPWNHASQPATDTANACVAGDYQDIADDTNNWKWKCNGKYSGTSTECSATKQPTCPSGFTSSNGKCVKWACQTRIKPWTHWCKNVITKDAQSLCTTITDQASCDDSYEVSIGYPWGDPNYQNLYPNAYRNIVLGPNLVSKDFAENKIVPYTPWGINMGYIWWTNGTSMFGYGKIGPCEWGEKEQIVSCKDLLNSILPETDCNLIPKPGKGQICTSPITPEPPQTPNPKHTPTCTEPDRTSFYSEGEVIRVADWSFSDETIKNDLRYYLNKFYIDNRGYTGKPYLYIPVTYPGTSSPTSVQGQVTLELQLKNSGVPDYYTYESGTYQFETQKGYLGPDTNYVRIQLKKSLPCSSSTCSFKVRNLTATLPPLTVPCPSTCPSGFSKYNGKCIQWKCIATTERKLSWECRDDGWNYVSTHDCESANASYDKSCPPKSGSTIPRPPVPPKKPPVPPLNGQCKTYAWSHTSQPATSKVTGCLAGDYEDIPDDATNWKWKCKGKNGGTETICSSIKEAYTPEIRLEEISHWSEYCWGNRYVHVTIKNPKWRSMKIEHSHTISSISNWGKVDMRWKEYSRKLQKQTSDQQYEFDLQKIPSSPICDWSVEGEFSVYVTVDWKETVMTHSYLNITKDKPYAACCLVEDPLKSGLWGI